MEIITGYTGKPHITSEQDRDINIGIFGAESYVLPTGMEMEAEISSNNEIKIRDGVLMHQGCAASIKKNTYDLVTITNGSQGMKRIDLIVARYEKNRDTNVESVTWKVLQGNPTESNPAVPDCVAGDIQAGDAVADMPMYKVALDGLNIVSIEKMFKVLNTISELNKNMCWNAGESFTFDGLYTAGYVTLSKTNIDFVIPLSKQVNASNVKVNIELIVRQNGKYILSNDYAKPAAVSAYIKEGYISVIATVSTMNDATNNCECGIGAKGTIEFT